MSVFWVQTGSALVPQESITPEEFRKVIEIEEHIYDPLMGERVEITILNPELSPLIEKVEQGRKK